MFNGILLIDKPSGYSSNNVLQKIKNIFNKSKAGYIGTLDPLATGMLPICFGLATKFSKFLSDTDKVYYVIGRLGEKTNTSDSCGKIINVREINFSLKKLKNTINNFIGTSFQTPSMYSAIKYNGIPLYKYARQGIKITIKPRKIKIYDIKYIDYINNNIFLKIYCSKGTYIRTLIEDLGEKLGCGAHVTELRRTKLANFNFKDMLKINDLNNILKNSASQDESIIFNRLNSLLISIDQSFDYLPKVILMNNFIFLLKKGFTIKFKNKKLLKGLIRINDTKNNFIGIAEIKKINYILPLRLIH